MYLIFWTTVNSVLAYYYCPVLHILNEPLRWESEVLKRKRLNTRQINVSHPDKRQTDRRRNVTTCKRVECFSLLRVLMFLSFWFCFYNLLFWKIAKNNNVYLCCNLRKTSEEKVHARVGTRDDSPFHWFPIRNVSSATVVCCFKILLKFSFWIFLRCFGSKKCFRCGPNFLPSSPVSPSSSPFGGCFSPAHTCVSHCCAKVSAVFMRCRKPEAPAGPGGPSVGRCSLLRRYLVNLSLIQIH